MKISSAQVLAFNRIFAFRTDTRQKQSVGNALNDIASFCRLDNWIRPKPQHKAHCHKEHQITYVLKGNFQYSVGNIGKYDAKVGDLIWLPAGCIHELGRKSRGTRLSIYLDVERLASQSMAVQKLQLPRVMNYQRYFEILSYLVNNIDEAYIDSVGPAIVQAVVLDVLKSIAEFNQLPRKNLSSQDYSALVSKIQYEKAVLYMEQNFKSDLSLREISRFLGLSPRHLSRLFRKHSRKTVYQALLDIRLDAARDLILRNPTLQKKVVGFNCGFKSASNFTASYRRKFGIRPTDTWKSSKDVGSARELSEF